MTAPCCSTTGAATAAGRDPRPDVRVDLVVRCVRLQDDLQILDLTCSAKRG